MQKWQEKKRKAKEPEPLKNDPMDAGVGEIVPEEPLQPPPPVSGFASGPVTHLSSGT